MEDAGGGDAPVWVQSQQPSADLVGAPAPSLSAEFQGGIDHVRLRGVWMRADLMRAVHEAVGSFGLVALEPLVAGLTADAVAQAELGVREQAASGLENESLSFVHGIGFQPWHGASLWRPMLGSEIVTHHGSEKCYLSWVSVPNVLQQPLGHAKMETTAIYANALGDEKKIVARMWA